MIGDVEHLETDCGVVTEHTQPLCHLRVERDEGRKPAGGISAADKVPIRV